MRRNKIRLQNVFLMDDSYKINESISLEKDHKLGNTIIVETDESEDPYESNIMLFHRAIQLALPKVNIRVGSFDRTEDSAWLEVLQPFNTSLLNYYAVKNNIALRDISKIKLMEDDIQKIREVFQLVINYNKQSNIELQNEEWKPYRWQYAYQQYLNACSSSTLENSLLSLITGLESLLVDGDGSLSYRVSLNAALIVGKSVDERKDIYKKIRYLYNLRSKVVHGEIKSVVKILSKPDIYDRYYELKAVLSELLIKVKDIEEEALFEKIETMIFNSPQMK